MQRMDGISAEEVIFAVTRQLAQPRAPLSVAFAEMTAQPVVPS